MFELGFKSTLLNGSMQLNGAAFYNIWKDQQVFNVGTQGPVFSNLPESQMYGMELEMKYVPAESWLIAASVGLLHSEITDSTGLDYDSGQGEYQKGHRLALAPNMSANMAVFKDFQIGANLLTLQMDWRYQGNAKAKYKPSYPIDEYDSRFELNARGSYRFGDQQQYLISAYLNNITADKYCLEKQDLHVLVGAYYCVPNEGELQFGLSGKVNF